MKKTTGPLERERTQRRAVHTRFAGWAVAAFDAMRLLAVRHRPHTGFARPSKDALPLIVEPKEQICELVEPEPRDPIVRHVFAATICVPTLVMHRTGGLNADFKQGGWLALQIPARLVGLSSGDHPTWIVDQHVVTDELQHLVPGSSPMRGVDRVLATILFADIVHSTEHLARVGDEAWRDLLARFYALVRAELAPFRGHEVDKAGDGFFATFDGPARAVRCALSIQEAARKLGIAVRAGLHTGEIELDGDTVSGIAVHIGARVSALAGANETLVSSTVKDLVSGSGLCFRDRGTHVLRGVPGEWRLYAAS